MPLPFFCVTSFAEKKENSDYSYQTFLWSASSSSFFLIINIEREGRDENVFLKVEVTLKNVDSHLQNRKIYFSYSNKS